MLSYGVNQKSLILRGKQIHSMHIICLHFISMYQGVTENYYAVVCVIYSYHTAE